MPAQLTSHVVLTPVHVAACRGDRISPPRIVVDTAEGTRYYVKDFPAQGPDSWDRFVHRAAHTLSDDQKRDLARSLLDVIGTEDRTEAIAQSAGRFFTPRVHVDSA